jgi:hypothetical protein
MKSFDEMRHQRVRLPLAVFRARRFNEAFRDSRLARLEPKDGALKGRRARRLTHLNGGPALRSKEVSKRVWQQNGRLSDQLDARDHGQDAMAGIGMPRDSHTVVGGLPK